MGLLAAAGAPGWVGAADVDRLGTWHFEPGDSRLPAAVPFVAPALGGRPVAGMLGGGLEFQEGDRPLVLPLSGLRSASTGRGWEPGAVSVRFWYRPSWTTLGRDAGTGPRRPAFLVSAGPDSRDGTGPVWELSILPEGRQFELALGEGGLGRRISSRSVACVFDAGRWSEVILSVFRGRARLVFDSATVLEMEVGRWPESPSAWDEGICVGARRDGTGSMLGTLDQMEWRATPMGRVEGLKTGRVFSVEVGAGDASLDLSWRVPGGAKVDLQRRREGAQAWTSLAQVQGRATYRAAAVQPGWV